MGNGFFGKHAIDQYFLDQACPYTKRRKIKMKSVYWTLGVFVTLFVVGVLFFGEEQNHVEFQTSVTDYSAQNSNVSMGGVALTQNQGTFGSTTLRSLYDGGRMDGNSSTRTRTANQVIKRGENGSDSSLQLPIGYGISVRLLNAIHSGNTASPVVAEVIDDVFKENILSIPSTTRVIGQASYNESAGRIQLRFHTFVYPNGEQHSVQALGLMSDGSAGLDGDYHSGAVNRQVGQLLGNFASGFAEGMKERRSYGTSGIPYAPASLKNGILSGITNSAEDQVKSYTDELGQTKSFMTLSAGQNFILFLEKEYQP